MYFISYIHMIYVYFYVKKYWILILFHYKKNSILLNKNSKIKFDLFFIIKI